MELSKSDLDTLERMIDATSLDDVIHALATVCGEKAEHLRSNWQDDKAARAWDRDAVRLNNLTLSTEN